MQVLVSLHDVAPLHLARLRQAEALLVRAGVTRAAYFLVPDFHRRHPVSADPVFLDWCRRARPFSVDWVLHGHDHLEPDAGRSDARAMIGARMKRAFLTAGEGEFLALAPDDARDRVARGLVALRAAGLATDAFVAPAWLYNPSLPPILVAAGVRYTEDHRSVFDLVHGVTRRCPVITWATRTTLRRVGSRAICPALLGLWRNEPAIRIALHPFDFDHPRTVESITRVLDAAVGTRRGVGHAELFQSC